MIAWVRLAGRASSVKEAPKTCLECGSQHLYVQADFNKTIGLWLVGIAVALCTLFFVQEKNWFVIWSPMVAFLVIDRVCAWNAEPVAICYMCEHIHRGLTKSQAAQYPGFDLELSDRLHYAARTAPQNQ